MLTGRKLALTLAFTVLVAVATGVSCKGFFVKPTLNSITVTPATPSIQEGSSNNTVQMTATGTFNDGSTGNPPVTWSISPAGFATISTGGLVTSEAQGTATITATSTQMPSIAGTQSLTVTIGCIQSIAVTPLSSNLSVSIANENTAQLTAKATTTCAGTVDITGTATWNSTSTATATVVGGLVTAVAQGSTNITASSGNITSSPVAVVTVGP
jgi:Bacterial Ig-like domain (group 2)